MTLFGSCIDDDVFLTTDDEVEVRLALSNDAPPKKIRLDTTMKTPYRDYDRLPGPSTRIIGFDEDEDGETLDGIDVW